MAIATAQKYQILGYLGWPLRTIDSTSLSYSNIITARLTTFPSDAETMLTAKLAQIAAIETQIQTMVTRSNVKAVDDIEFFEDGSADLRRTRMKVIKELAVMVDIAFGPGCSGGMVSVSV